MTLSERLQQLARFHREHGLRYVHPKFGEQTMATMVAEIEEAAERIAELEDAIDTVVMAAELLGYHCEMTNAVAQAKRVLLKR